MRHLQATLGRISLNSFDPDAMEEAVRHSEFEHCLTGPGDFRGAVLQAENSKTRVAWGRYNLPVLARGPLAPDSMTIGFVLNREEHSLFNGSSLPPGSLLLYAEGHELHACLPHNCNWLSLQVDRQTLYCLGIEPPGFGFDAWVPVNKTVQALQSRLLTNLIRLDEIYHHGEQPTAARSANDSLANIEDHLLSALSKIPSSRSFHPLFCPTAQRDNVVHTVRDAESYMDQNIDLPITISEICVALGANIKALERAFLHTYGIGPKQYLQRKRLARLRRILCRQSDTPLMDAYFSCGLPHFGRAAQSYKALFGELPSQTMSQSGP